MSNSRVAVMVEGALCIALAVVLSKFDLMKRPNGGSIDVGLAPLLLFAWRRGLKWGCGAGALAGILKILLGGYVLNPVQAALEYPVAYGMTGLAALFPRTKGQIAGLILAFLGQTSCHVAAGAVFFAQYAPEGQDPWVYSAFYNVPVIGVKYILSGVAAWLLWRALERAMPVRQTR